MYKRKNRTARVAPYYKKKRNANTSNQKLLGGEYINWKTAAVSANDQSITLVKRSVNLGQLNENNTLTAYGFKLSDLPGSAGFNLFDQYRFKVVKVKFVNMYPVNQTYWNGAAAVQDALSSLVTAVDTDDINAPTSEAIVLQHDTAIIHGCPRIASRTFKPEVAVGLYSGAFTSFGSLKNQWIDMASPSVLHYGLKVSLINGTNSPGSNWGYEIYATYVIEMRKMI